MPVVVCCQQLSCDELDFNTTFKVTFLILWSECGYKRRPLRSYRRMCVLSRECRVMHEELALDDLQLVVLFFFV